MFSFPVSFAEHETPHAGGCASREIAAAPHSHERQAVHVKRLSVTDGPLLVRHADRAQHTFEQKSAEIPLCALLQGGGEDVTEHRHTGIAVLKPCAGIEKDWRLVPREGEWIVRRREPLPKIPFPTGQSAVRQTAFFGIGEAGSVRAQLPQRNF